MSFDTEWFPILIYFAGKKKKRKKDGWMKIELLERANVYPPSDQTAENRIIMDVWGLRNLLNFAISL